MFADASQVSSQPLSPVDAIDMASFMPQQVNAPPPAPGLTLVARALTDAKGAFRVGPFYFEGAGSSSQHPSSLLTLRLHKPGYEFAQVSGTDGWPAFTSQKLALVEIKVVSAADTRKQALSSE